MVKRTVIQMKKLITICAVAAITSVAYALPSDNFNDNSMNTSMWSLYQERPNVWLDETNERLEVRSTTDVNAAGVAYFANDWGLLTADNFSFKADFHCILASGYYEFGAMLGLGKCGGDPITMKKNSAVIKASSAGDEYVNHMKFSGDKTTDGNSVEVAQKERSQYNGILYISYDSIADNLYLSDAGYWATNAWITIPGVLKGEWNSDVVIPLLGGRYVHNIALDSGDVYLDNFVVDSGTIVQICADPNDYLIPGKSYMCEGTLSGLRQAYQTFDAGLNDPCCTECAASRELKFLHAVTRTAMLFIDNNDSNNIPIDSFLEVAEKFGVNVLGDFFEEIDVNVPLTNDHYKIPGTAPGSDEISNFFSNKVADWITEVNDIIADLNSISDSSSNRFRFFFEPSDTGLETNLEVDYGDLLILKGLLLAFKGTLESKLAYDVFLNVDESLLHDLLYVDGIGPDDVNSPEILHLINIDVTDPNQLSINDHFLTPYPNLLKVLPTPGHPEDGAAILAQAKQDLINGINYYFDALDYIQSENNPPGTDPQEDELLYIDPNNQFFLNVVEDRLTTLRDSLVNNTNMLCPVETTKTYNVYNSTHTHIGQLTLKYDFTGIAGPNGVLTFTAGGIPSPWEINETRTGYGPEINVELECHVGGHYNGYLDATLSQDGTSFGNGTLEYWGDSTNVISGLSGQLTSTNVVNGKINLNPIFGSSPPVNPRDLLPLFNNENIPIAGTFGHGLGNDATLGGILPDMTQEYWTTLFDLPPAPDLPDLACESITTTLPDPAIAGDKGKVRVVVKNQGQALANGRINIDVYASLDEELDLADSDVLLGSAVNQSINLTSDKSKAFNINVVIPADMVPGEYYLWVYIDSGNAIDEADEDNNVAAGEDTFKVEQSDLVGTMTDTFKEPAAAGDKAKVKVVVTNDGNVLAKGKIDIDIYLSADPNLDGGDTPLTTVTSKSINLKPGKSKTFNISVVLPTDLEPGDYYFLADIDSGNAITEGNEDNNVANDPIEIERPDLIGTKVTPTFKKANPGKKGTVKVEVKNDANVPAKGKIDIDIYISTDQTLDVNDALLATAANKSINLKPGKSKTFNISVTLPMALTQGNYYFLGDVDSADAIDESNEGNNLAASANALMIQ